MKKKGLVAILAIVAVVATAGMSFAYWVSSISGANSNGSFDVNIGEGGVATTIVNITEDAAITDELVPTGITPAAGQTNTVTFDFIVNWDIVDADDIDLDGATGTLAVELSSFSIDGTAGDITTDVGYRLFNVTFDTSRAITAGTPETITVTITMDMPADQAEYIAVANQSIAAAFTFTVTPTVA